ncbi:inactive phospholipase D5 isoform X2 [Salmo salar]|uniref:Inactive phospholipase D5 isoform X2 n=1 Tax=Salmo salar TaxID=8030 RepID=A0ABM3DDM3_SALSA|nr:inactive phospholipase D5-like isoform X2 [Salmo salar]
MKSQQKCIVIFALVCCFAVLVALIFSAVDVWGEDEDGITEENCNKNCRVVLVENIPEDVTFSENGTSHLPLSAGLHSLLDLAVAGHSVEIVSPQWNLNSSDYESRFLQSSRQGQALLQRLQGLKKKGINLKIASGRINSSELKSLSRHSEVHYINMTALTKGFLHSSFWVVDRQHIYIGSATMDWRSLSTMKELGIIVYNCSCLALDLHRVFNLYWQLQYKDFIPSMWSKRLSALWNKDENLPLLFNNTKAEVFVSSSPDVFCPKDRTRDLDAIAYVIQKAKRFIYISITDYLPLTNRNAHRYWSRIDGMLREALILRNIEKFFSPRKQRDGTLQGINHNRFMVTDSAVYIGNFDWVGNEFMFNAGAGMVISQAEGVKEKNSTLVEQVRATFERDWYSRHTKSLQANKIPVCNKHQLNQLAHLKITQPTESNGSKEGPNGSL